MLAVAHPSDMQLLNRLFMLGFLHHRITVYTPFVPACVLLQIPGVPIMYLSQHRYSIERLPEATIGGAPRT
jgi:hypothetical protein